jgi:hypothetical protein
LLFERKKLAQTSQPIPLGSSLKDSPSPNFRHQTRKIYHKVIHSYEKKGTLSYGFIRRVLQAQPAAHISTSHLGVNPIITTSTSLL